jgi:CheY-like chemotaxis protein
VTCSGNDLLTLSTDIPDLSKIEAGRMEDDRERLAGDSRVNLVVKDDEPFARILYDLARQPGFQCLIAMTAEEALAVAAQYAPSGVVRDIGLPVFDRLKCDRRTRHISVHVFSVHDYTQTVLSLGAAGHPSAREVLHGPGLGIGSVAMCEAAEHKAEGQDHPCEKASDVRHVCRWEMAGHAGEQCRHKPYEDQPWTDAAELLKADYHIHSQHAHNGAACPDHRASVTGNMDSSRDKSRRRIGGHVGRGGQSGTYVSAEDPESDQISDQMHRGHVKPHVPEQGGDRPRPQDKAGKVLCAGIQDHLDRESACHQKHDDTIAERNPCRT